MFNKLHACLNRNITVELVNGRIISGVLLAVNEQHARLETGAGVGTIPIKAIQIIWEAPEQTITGENMARLAEKLRDSARGHSCAGQQFYGVTGPVADSGGCPIFQYGTACVCQYQQPCAFQYQQPCVCQYQEPCAFQYQQPCVCLYQQPCPAQFQMPCMNQYQQPCVCPFTPSCAPFQFQQPCGSFPFGGSQCCPTAWFSCAGQPFSSVTGPTAGTAPGMPPVSSPMPAEFTAGKDQKNNDAKEKE